MGRPNLGRSRPMSIYVTPEVGSILDVQKPNVNEFINVAVKEKLARETVVFRGTMSEVQKQIAVLKKKHGADTLMSDVVKLMAKEL